jgi:hypothetical protein
LEWATAIAAAICVQFVEIEQLESTTVQRVVMDAKDSFEEV